MGLAKPALHSADIVRPEKDHAKQLQALALLMNEHPEYRSGPARVSLTLMGGARHPADEARVESLRSLSRDLGVDVSPRRSREDVVLICYRRT